VDRVGRSIVLCKREDIRKGGEEQRHRGRKGENTRGVSYLKIHTQLARSDIALPGYLSLLDLCFMLAGWLEEGHQHRA
jgi:hypothetical protein